MRKGLNLSSTPALGETELLGERREGDDISFLAWEEQIILSFSYAARAVGLSSLSPNDLSPLQKKRIREIAPSDSLALDWMDAVSTFLNLSLPCSLSFVRHTSYATLLSYIRNNLISFEHLERERERERKGERERKVVRGEKKEKKKKREKEEE